MFNERIKSMGIGSHHVYDNTNDYKDYWVGAESPSPKNATNVQGSGCYIVKKDERERVWVIYKTYYTYHCLCKNHIREHNLSKKKD